jgi:Ca-activated chloride channel family protein
MTLAEPLFLLVSLLAVWHVWRHWRHRRAAKAAHVGFPALGRLPAARGDRRARWLVLPVVLRALALVLVAVALARPQSAVATRESTVRGRTLVVALDISSSMKARDFRPVNRLEVAKERLADFIRRRDGDLIGLVIFAARAFVAAPLTLDGDLLTQVLSEVEVGRLPDGTAIGTALATSLTLVKDLPASSAVVLLTDGANNTGKPGPLVAAEAARALGVRVYAIGVATSDPFHNAFQVDARFDGETMEVPYPLTPADEAVIERMAVHTGGQYYRASDPRALARAMSEIDRLEKADVRVRELRRYDERFALALVPAACLLALETLLVATWLRTVP